MLVHLNTRQPHPVLFFSELMLWNQPISRAPPQLLALSGCRMRKGWSTWRIGFSRTAWPVQAHLAARTSPRRKIVHRNPHCPRLAGRRRESNVVCPRRVMDYVAQRIFGSCRARQARCAISLEATSKTWHGTKTLIVKRENVICEMGKC